MYGILLHEVLERPGIELTSCEILRFHPNEYLLSIYQFV